MIESFENYLKTKFFDTKIHQEIEKKFKTYKKDLNQKFRDKIDRLSQLTYDQAKYNELISELIADMKLDESFDDNDKDEENKPEQQKNPKNQEQNTKTQEEEQEMSIKTGVPDLESEAKETNQEEEEIEIQDKSKSDFKKNIKKSLGDLKYKTYTEEFDEVIKAEELESEDELIRLEKI